MTVKHHLLEIILWPNEDGTTKEIRHSVDDLKALRIYEKDIMTIEMTRAEHASLHHKGQKETRPHVAWNKGKKCPGIGGRKPGFTSPRKGKKYGHVNSGPKKGSHWKLVNGKRIYYMEANNG